MNIMIWQNIFNINGNATWFRNIPYYYIQFKTSLKFAEKIYMQNTDASEKKIWIKHTIMHLWRVLNIMWCRTGGSFQLHWLMTCLTDINFLRNDETSLKLCRQSIIANVNLCKHRKMIRISKIARDFIGMNFFIFSSPITF